MPLKKNFESNEDAIKQLPTKISPRLSTFLLVFTIATSECQILQRHMFSPGMLSCTRFQPEISDTNIEGTSNSMRTIAEHARFHQHFSHSEDMRVVLRPVLTDGPHPLIQPTAWHHDSTHVPPNIDQFIRLILFTWRFSRRMLTGPGTGNLKII